MLLNCEESRLDDEFVVYKITNSINDKVYVGQTVQKLRERLDANNIENHYNEYLRNAFNKHGYDSFCVSVLSYCDTIDELNEKEAYWISFYGSTEQSKGYNLLEGGNNKRHHNLTREKLRKANTGHITTPETREKIRKAMLGRDIIWGDKITASKIKVSKDAIVEFVRLNPLSTINDMSKHFGYKSKTFMYNRGFNLDDIRTLAGLDANSIRFAVKSNQVSTYVWGRQIKLR